MSPLDALGQPAWRHLVFALLHTLWQGVVLALLAALALRLLPARRQDERYLVALAAQFGVLLAGLLTWAALGYDPRTNAEADPAGGRVRTPAAQRPGSDVATGEAEVPVPADPGVAAAPIAWVPLAALGWLIGVGMMLAGSAGSALAAQKLTRGSPPADRAILDAVERLGRELGIGRPVRVVAAERVSSPAVLGLVWPTLVLPVSLMTGLPPEALRAILTHELAHIRRHDYAANLAQLVVESLLFFNPAAWWLGRQARIEREACCDAVAVRLTGRPLDYARVLADWAERARGGAVPSVAMAWSGEGRPSPLRDRVLRVLRPGETPRPRVSWTGLVALLLVGPLALVGLRKGTTEAVALAAQALSPSERVVRLERAQAEYAPLDAEKPGKATLKGTIRMSDGSPPPFPVTFSTITDGPSGGSMGYGGEHADEFSIEVPSGVTWVLAYSEDRSQAAYGPFEAKAGGTVEGIRIILGEGFPARVRVVDEGGKPVAGARVKCMLPIGGGTVSSQPGWVTDREGLVIIPHAERRTYGLSVTAAGFRVDSSFKLHKLTPTPGETTTVSITHARPTRGVVLDQEGKPVGGASLRVIANVKDSGFSNHYGLIGPILATTDEAGRFTLDALDDETSYFLLVETRSGGRGVSPRVRAGLDGLRLIVKPGLTLQGHIKGGLGTLRQDGGKPSLRIDQRARIDDERARLGDLESVVPVDAEGRFLASGLIPGEALVRAGGHSVSLKLERPETELTIDLTDPRILASRRDVVLRIVPPGGRLPVRGAIEVDTNGEGTRISQFRREDVPLEGGEATIHVPAPGSLNYRPRPTIGYWFPEGSLEVEPAEGPLVVEIPAFPAGAIVGQVLVPDGKPADGSARVSCRSVEAPPEVKRGMISLDNVRVDAQGRFYLGPLPIGGTYVVVVSRGHNKQVSKPVRLDGSEATVRVELRLAGPVAAGGRVVGPDGRPVAGVPVTLKLDHPQAGTSWGPPTPTDRDGRFRFDDLSSELGVYGVSLDIRKDYQPAEATLNPGGPPVEMKLERGHVVAGRVVDAATGRPIPGVEVYAHRDPYRPGGRHGFESEARTDEEGRFRFSNLPTGRFKVGDRDGLNWESDEARDVSSDQAEAVEVRATLPAWSKRKPVGRLGG